MFVRRPPCGLSASCDSVVVEFWGGDLVPVGCIWPPGGLGCCLF